MSLLTCHLYLELRFAPSIGFLASGMRIAQQMTDGFPIFNSDAVSIRFRSEDRLTELSLEPARVLVVGHGGPVSTRACLDLALRAMRTWKQILGDLPRYTRVGFRAQLAQPTAMTRAELIEICSKAFLASHTVQKFPSYDFALTLENFEGAEGERYIIGAMHHDEIVEKWTPEFPIEEPASSYLTVDADCGTAEAQGFGFEGFVMERWGRMLEVVSWLSEPLG